MFKMKYLVVFQSLSQGQSVGKTQQRIFVKSTTGRRLAKAQLEPPSTRIIFVRDYSTNHIRNLYSVFGCQGRRTHIKLELRRLAIASTLARGHVVVEHG